MPDGLLRMLTGSPMMITGQLAPSARRRMVAVPGAAQGLMVAPQHNGLVNFKNSRRQHHFAAACRQRVQCLLDFGAGRTGRQRDNHRFRGKYLRDKQIYRRKSQTAERIACLPRPPRSLI